MERIIEGRSCGKTKKLLQYAADNQVVVFCAIPGAIRTKAEAYGIFGLDIQPYENLTPDFEDEYVIDEIELYFSHICRNGNLKGYTLSNED